jgi:hypothetical protein
MEVSATEATGRDGPAGRGRADSVFARLVTAIQSKEVVFA